MLKFDIFLVWGQFFWKERGGLRIWEVVCEE